MAIQGDAIRAIGSSMPMALHTRSYIWSCSFPVLERRLISRQSATKHVAKGGSPRCDDIPALVHKRILVHEQDCLPVIESYEAENRLLTIRCDNKNIDEVVQATRELILQQ